MYLSWGYQFRCENSSRSLVLLLLLDDWSPMEATRLKGQITTIDFTEFSRLVMIFFIMALQLLVPPCPVIASLD